MIDTKHVLTAGVDEDVRNIYNEYIDQLESKINDQGQPSRAALKSLMNILIGLEESRTDVNDDNALPMFGITMRLMYMRLFDYLSAESIRPEKIESYVTGKEPLITHNPEGFIDQFRALMDHVFSIFKPFLDADDDVDRFSRVIDRYAERLKSKKDAASWMKLIGQFARFCDVLYPLGYRKVNDGWGGKLDLDSDVYPLFFNRIIADEIMPFEFSLYTALILYDRLKEVGEAETVLSGLYDFTRALKSETNLYKNLKQADQKLWNALEAAIGQIDQKEEKLTDARRREIAAALPEFEQLEGLIYFFFDEKKILNILEETRNEVFADIFFETIRPYPPKITHFVMYAFGKLLIAPESQIRLTDSLIRTFCEQLKTSLEVIYSEPVLNNLPAQYRHRIPDLEIRFFLNRIMTNTTTFDGYERAQEQFRHFIVHQSEFPLIHEIFIERAAEKRHASALMSFYIAAALQQEMGDVMPETIIKILAGRLSLTYSFTRRFNLFKEIKKLRYEYDGSHEGKETVYYNGFDRQEKPVPEKEKHTPLKDRPIEEQWIILYHIINNRELQWALRLIDEAVLFDYILARDNHEQDLQNARMELRGKVYKIIDDKFLDLFTDAEEHDKRMLENKGLFPAGYYGKYEKIRSIMIAQFIASGWDMEVYELKRKGKRPLIRMTQNELLRSIKNIDAKTILEQYEYKEAREHIDVNSLQKQVETREDILANVNQASREEVKIIQKMNDLSDEAIALLSYCSTRLRNKELQVELGIKQLVERLKSDLGYPVNRPPLPLDKICRDCFEGKYGKIDVKVIKKDKNGKPLIDPETGEEAEKTYTITPNSFPEYLIPARDQIYALDKKTLYRVFYLVTLNSIIAETFSSLTFIKEALNTNKYVIAADGLKEQSIENQELLDYARIKFDMIQQLMPYELRH